MTPEEIDTIRTFAREEIAAAEARIASAIATAQGRTVEAMRDMQSEILRGIEAFARDNFARMVRLETETRQHPTQ